SGSVDTTAGNLSTPDQRATSYVVQIDKRLSFEEALPGIGHTIFHDRFILGMMGPDWIGQKAPVVGVLQKRPVEARGVGVGLIDTSFHSVDDHAPRTTTPKHPGALEAIDNRGQILFEHRDHAAESAVAERQNKALNDTGLAATKFLQRAESAEVDFCHFARQTLRSPDADRRSRSEIAPLTRKSIQAAIGDDQPLAA